MAPKRKEDPPTEAVDEDAAKKAKTEDVAEDAEKKDDEMKVEEEEKEKEKDDAKDSRAVLKGAIAFETSDTTLNLLPSYDGRILMCMADGGMQFLIAGARANVGVKSGRYFYEAKVLEALTHFEGDTRPAQVGPKQMVRIGFSDQKASLLLGETAGGVCFDATGSYTSFAEIGAAPTSVKVSQQFGKDQVIGVLLNLDAKSPNNNTVSLFRNGVRISEPQALPESLKGKALFPHIAFRNVTVQVNFGKEPLFPLPFKSRMIQEAAQADVKENRAVAPKGGKYDVLFPVGFPDEGTFEWLDGFLEKNPQYMELSDRMIHDWIQKSGHLRCRNRGSISNDKPPFNYGVRFVDDNSIRRVINSIAPLSARHFVVMEVKQNLVSTDRSTNLALFNQPHFKRIAYVVMGEPKNEFKERVHAKMLANKQVEEDQAWRRKKAELDLKKRDKERRKAAAEKQKQIAEAQERIEAARKEAEEAKKAEESGAAATEGNAATEEKKEEKTDEAEKTEDKKDEAEKPDAEMKSEEKTEDKAEEKKEEETKPEEAKPQTTDEKKEDEKKEEETKQEVKEEDSKDEEKKEEEKKEEEPESEDEVMAEEPATAELTDEEKETKFFKPPFWKDLLEGVLNSSFGQFSIPEKTEGFDEIKYEWDDAAKSKQYLKAWVLDKKITSRIENIQPGEAFNTALAEFQKVTEEYEGKQAAHAAKPKAEPAAPKAEPVEGAEPAEEEKKGEKEDVDIQSLTDICDIGSGEPLFANFSFEDWSLYKLRFELYSLMAAFKKDNGDAERVGIHQSNLSFYYNRYFRKLLVPFSYGKETLEQVVELVKDSFSVDATNGVLTCKHADDKNVTDFVKLQEENRRDRQRRIDAGDETVRLNFDALRQQLEQDKRAAEQHAARAEQQKRQNEERQRMAEERAKAAEIARQQALERAKQQALQVATMPPPTYDAPAAGSGAHVAPRYQPPPQSKGDYGGKGGSYGGGKGDKGDSYGGAQSSYGGKGEKSEPYGTSYGGKGGSYGDSYGGKGGKSDSYGDKGGKADSYGDRGGSSWSSDQSKPAWGGDQKSSWSGGGNDQASSWGSGNRDTGGSSWGSSNDQKTSSWSAGGGGDDKWSSGGGGGSGGDKWSGGGGEQKQSWDRGNQGWEAGNQGGGKGGGKDQGGGGSSWSASGGGQGGW